MRVKWDAKETKLTRNFWIPEMTPEAKADKAEKPDPNLYCPTSGKRLRIKDLIPVKFTPVDKTKYASETNTGDESGRRGQGQGRERATARARAGDEGKGKGKGVETPVRESREWARARAWPLVHSTMCCTHNPQDHRRAAGAKGALDVPDHDDRADQRVRRALSRPLSHPCRLMLCSLCCPRYVHSTPCAVLRPSGSVITMDAVNNVIKKVWTRLRLFPRRRGSMVDSRLRASGGRLQDMVDPFTGDALTDADIIPIIRGGTGFAGAGVDLKPKTYTPALQAS